MSILARSVRLSEYTPPKQLDDNPERSTNSSDSGVSRRGIIALLESGGFGELHPYLYALLLLDL